MKVGISGYVGNRLTGIGRVLANVVSCLARQHGEDEYILFTNCDFDAFDYLESAPNVSVLHVCPSKESPLANMLWHQCSFQRNLVRYGCDIAYIPNFTLLLWKSRPTVVTIHDLIEFNVPGKFSRLRMFYRKHICDPLMARNSNAILTVSKSSERDIVKYLGVKPEKITVTPNAVDRKAFRKYHLEEIAAVMDRMGLQINHYILFVGTIDYPGKNVKAVIESYVRLRKAGKLQDIKLVIVGKNGHGAEIIFDLISSSGYESDIVRPGYVPDADLPILYSGAYAFMYLSYYEGFGLPVLEAMSCGAPVICSNTSCFPEVAGNLDICVDPDDVEAISIRLLRLDDADYRNEISIHEISRAKSFSWEASAEIYHKVFSSLVSK